MTEQLPLSQQAATPVDAMESLWKIWPATGKRRTQGLKANSQRKQSVSPKERCRAALDAATQNHSLDLIMNAAKAYIDNTDEKFVMGLERWLEECRWENEAATSGNADKLEPPRREGKTWQMATSQAKAMLKAMSEKGCPDDVLDALFADGVGVTHVNRDRGIPPTAVLKTTYGMNLWYRAASGFANRAGYNEHAYSPQYVQHAREKQQGSLTPA